MQSPFLPSAAAPPDPDPDSDPGREKRANCRRSAKDSRGSSSIQAWWQTPSTCGRGHCAGGALLSADCADRRRGYVYAARLCARLRFSSHRPIRRHFRRHLWLLFRGVLRKPPRVKSGAARAGCAATCHTHPSYSSYIIDRLS